MHHKRPPGGDLAIFKNIIDHGFAALSGMKKRSKVYERHNIDFDPLINTLLFRHRRYINFLLAEGSLALIAQVNEGEDVQKWRSASLQTPLITRHCMIALTRQATVTVSQVETESKASRESVRKCLNHGVELGLLKKSAGGKKSAELFEITEKLTEQLADRTALKLHDQKLYELSRLIVMIHELRDFREKSKELERIDGIIPGDAWRILQEVLLEQDKDETGEYLAPKS
jgi:hypothetical protein